jgi:hypothetical protein
MCDYSLHNVASRPAKAGDKLVTTDFIGSGTRGFSAIGEPDVAECLRPGAELTFTDEAKYDHVLAWLFPKSRFGNIGEKVARFRQINLDDPIAHHDALEFANGKVVLLTSLRPGQCATVLQLPAQAYVTVKHDDRAPARARSRHAGEPGTAGQRMLQGGFWSF